MINQRREKIEELIDNTIMVSLIFWDNPNGGHQYSCPYCRDTVEVGGGEFVYIGDLDHDKDCNYLLAVELRKALENMNTHECSCKDNKNCIYEDGEQYCLTCKCTRHEK